MFEDQDAMFAFFNARFAVVKDGSKVRVLDESGEKLERLTKSEAETWFAPYQVHATRNGNRR